MRQSGMRLADMAKNPSSEAFFGCDDPLEPVLFPALLEIQKRQAEDITRVDP
jgi:hypothetical protein